MGNQHLLQLAKAYHFEGMVIYYEKDFTGLSPEARRMLVNFYEHSSDILYIMYRGSYTEYKQLLVLFHNMKPPRPSLADALAHDVIVFGLCPRDFITLYEYDPDELAFYERAQLAYYSWKMGK